MQTFIPKLRLSSYNLGSEVTISGTCYIVTAIREDGYYELSNKKGRLILTAAPCHEVG